MSINKEDLSRFQIIPEDYGVQCGPSLKCAHCCIEEYNVCGASIECDNEKQ